MLRQTDATDRTPWNHMEPVNLELHMMIYIYIYELLLAIRIGCHDLFCAVGQALSRGLFLHLYRWKP